MFMTRKLVLRTFVTH